MCVLVKECGVVLDVGVFGVWMCHTGVFVGGIRVTEIQYFLTPKFQSTYYV